MRRVTEWLATLPSTNARIALTLFVVLGTAVRYWSASSWEPSVEWLAFLATMSGIDGVVFTMKRKTHSEKNGTDSPRSDAK